MTSYQGKLYMINEIGQYRMLYDSITYTVFSWRIYINCNFFIIIVQIEKKNTEKKSSVYYTYMQRHKSQTPIHLEVQWWAQIWEPGVRCQINWMEGEKRKGWGLKMKKEIKAWEKRKEKKTDGVKWKLREMERSGLKWRENKIGAKWVEVERE